MDLKENEFKQNKSVLLQETIIYTLLPDVMKDHSEMKLSLNDALRSLLKLNVNSEIIWKELISRGIKWGALAKNG